MSIETRVPMDWKFPQISYETLESVKSERSL